jgi:multidrug efflux system membrane fusion protein
VAQVKQAEADLAKNIALVRQAESNLEKDTAQAKNAEVEAKRYELLIEKKVVAEQQYDQFRTNAEALDATVRADKAALESAKAAVRASQAAVENAEATVRADRAVVENARIQLGYCSIRSPMDGRTGSLIIQEGNMIKDNDAIMVVINQINPIYVAISVPEQYLAEIKKYMAEGKLKVEAIIPNDEARPEEGIITFVDNTVDSATGTIRLKGTFANKEKRLWPGQFVRVFLTLTEKPNAIVVPSQAIQTGQEGQYVFVVKPDLTVESRPVVLGLTLNNETVIQKGLNAGENVVTDGQLRLSPGAKVEIKASAPEASPKSSAR